MQCLSVEIVHYVERAEPAAIAQRIAHEIHRPSVIGRYGFNKRLLYPLRQPPLCFPSYVQSDKLIHPMDAFVVPSMALPA